MACKKGYKRYILNTDFSFDSPLSHGNLYPYTKKYVQGSIFFTFRCHDWNEPNIAL